MTATISNDLRRLIALAMLSLVLAACDDPFALPPANNVNLVDTITVFALTGSEIGLPSAYDMVSRRAAVTELGEPFDFVFDIRAGGSLEVSPTGAVGLPRGPGLQILPDSSFESVVRAPIQGYNADSATTVAVGDVVAARSRSSAQACVLGSVARFGKFRVLDVDPQAREVTIEILVNANCGFRSLEPGLPTD